MVRLEVFNPVAQSVEQRLELAPRVPDLNGKRIGLYWNLKGGGDVALQRTEAKLRERFPDATFRRYEGTVGFVYRHVTPKEADQIASECDVIIGTSSD